MAHEMKRWIEKRLLWMAMPGPINRIQSPIYGPLQRRLCPGMATDGAPQIRICAKMANYRDGYARRWPIHRTEWMDMHGPSHYPPPPPYPLPHHYLMGGSSESGLFHKRMAYITPIYGLGTCSIHPAGCRLFARCHLPADTIRSAGTNSNSGRRSKHASVSDHVSISDHTSAVNNHHERGHPFYYRPSRRREKSGIEAFLYMFKRLSGLTTRYVRQGRNRH